MNEYLLKEALHALKLLSDKRIQSVYIDNGVDESLGKHLTVEVYYDDNVEVIKTKDGNIANEVD